VHQLNISVPDGVRLYAWHILPLQVYRRHEQDLLHDVRAGQTDHGLSHAFKSLQDADSLLVINCKLSRISAITRWFTGSPVHGNAGHVAQGWRTDTYRALAAGDNSRIHVLAFDYRGYGHSTGAPTEEGIIRDGIAAVRWALDVAGLPPSRIALVGQSLGVAVAIAVSEHFAVHEKIEFAGQVFVAGFSDLPTLLETYAMFHAVPIFSPLRPYPKILNFFSSRIVDRWPSTTRLAKFVKATKNVDVQFIHAKNDYDIPWKHSDKLFYTAVNATSDAEGGLTVLQINAARKHTELGRGGWTNEWKAASTDGVTKTIRQTVVRDGGHNRIMTYGPLSKAVLDVFDSRKASSLQADSFYIP